MVFVVSLCGVSWFLPAAEGGQGVGTMEDLLGAQAMAMGEEDDDGNEGEGGLMGMMGEGNPLNFMRFHPQFDQVLGGLVELS